MQVIFKNNVQSTNLKLCLFTAPFCGICKRMVKKVPKLAAEDVWTECEFATCDTAIVPELKETLKIGGYPFWYIYHGNILLYLLHIKYA